jgi:hypothetical protein
MERNGIQPVQIRGVRGFADRQLRVKDKPLDARNRRVSVIVEGLWNKDALPDPVRDLSAGIPGEPKK